jgi:GT2 family glycosyltransferase
MIYIVIPVFNRWTYTEKCLRSLQTQTYKDFKIVVVDHGSTDKTSDSIKRDFPNVIVLNGDESMWWAAATNVGVKYAQQNNADYVLTLNNDLIVQSDYLVHLYDVAKKDPNSIVGSVSVDINEQSKVIYAGTKWNKWTAKYRSTIDFSKFKEIQTIIVTDLLPGRGTLIPVKAFDDLGLFDDAQFPHYAADEEFSLRCRKEGYELIISKNAVVCSEIDATGLKNIHSKRNIKYWKDLFTSIRSPLNIKYRWNWASKCTPIPPIYFILDMGRIIISQLKSLR